MRISQGDLYFDYDLPMEVAEVLAQYGHVIDPQGTGNPHARAFMDMGFVVEKDDLCNRLLSIDKAISKNSENIYKYTFEYNINNDPNLHVIASTLYQFKRNKQVYEIECGYNSCKIRLLHWDSQGNVSVAEECDGHHLQQIETDDWGPIIIKKRRAKNTFGKWATKIIKSLNGIQGIVRVEIA